MAYEKRLIDADAFMKRERRRDYRPFRLRRPPSLAIAALHGAIVQGRLGDAPRAENVVTQAWLELFDELEEGPDKAVILYVDSPGGLADASELLYQQIRRLSRKKPVFAYFGGVAASGGYYLACAANRIYSSPVSLTGSIGVIRMRPQASGLLKKLHIKSERLLFDETTDLLSPTDKPGRKSRKLLEASTASTYLDFMRRVAAGRGLTAEAVLAAAGGRVYVADELKETALIDATTDLIALIELFRKESKMKDGQALDIRLLPELQFSLRSVLRSGLPLSGSSVEISEALDAMLSFGGGWLKHLLLLRKEIMQGMVSGTPMLLDATLSLFSLSKRTSEDTTRSFRAAKKTGGKNHGRALVHALTKRRYPF